VASEYAHEDKRLDVHLGARWFAFLRPRNGEPEWPVCGWNESARAVQGDVSTREQRRLHRRRNYEWECRTLDDILTVLRWPDVLPSGPYASVNEIRDDHENPSKHVWVLVRGDVLRRVFECSACKQRLYVEWQETAEEVARMGYENWRERQAGKLRRATTLTRAMGVGFIPPHCPGVMSGGATAEAESSG
jgi:hypothetical protein